jgi:demethylmenaquinone methyltransferase / 2-methoxy-6-polyprenyl-1,4-benzoquinol methylase
MTMNMEAGFQQREANRVQVFSSVWDREINDVFADVAKYYDRANVIASLGMLGVWLRGFVSTIDVKPGDKVLDVCAGTNVMGIALMKKQPDLDVQAMDRSQEMQSVGKMRAEKLGFHIKSDIGDVHKLPYPDNHFDIVTLQYASRHLGILEVSKEINRVLKPGGHYYHCDMLRPSNPTVEKAYYAYLKGCLDIVSWLFGSKSAALNCRAYFIEAIKLFYSADEFSDLLRSSGFTNVKSTEVFGGMVAYHKARKP